MRCADAIAQWAVEKEIRHVFGIIGGGNVVLWDAIAKRPEIELVCVHHEQAAAMAATYYYRASGRMPLCLVTTGAGSTNAITGVMAAWMDSIPLLVISGNEESRYFRGRDMRVHGVQGYRSSTVAKDFTKWAVQVTSPNAAVSQLEHAMSVVSKSRQGPCWIDLPKDIQGASV